MKVRELLNALTVAERLKDATRYCYTSKGRHESVVEHWYYVNIPDNPNPFFNPILVPILGHRDDAEIIKIIRISPFSS